MFLCFQLGNSWQFASQIQPAVVLDAEPGRSLVLWGLGWWIGPWNLPAAINICKSTHITNLTSITSISILSWYIIVISWYIMMFIWVDHGKTNDLSRKLVASSAMQLSSLDLSPWTPWTPWTSCSWISRNLSCNTWNRHESHESNITKAGGPMGSKNELLQAFWLIKWIKWIKWIN